MQILDGSSLQVALCHALRAREILSTKRRIWRRTLTIKRLPRRECCDRQGLSCTKTCPWPLRAVQEGITAYERCFSRVRDKQNALERACAGQCMTQSGCVCFLDLVFLVKSQELVLRVYQS